MFLLGLKREVVADEHVVMELFSLIQDVQESANEVAARLGHLELLQNGDNNGAVLFAYAAHLFDTGGRIVKVVEGSEAKDEVKGARAEGQALTLAINDATMSGLSLGHTLQQLNGGVESKLVGAVDGRKSDSSAASNVQEPRIGRNLKFGDDRLKLPLLLLAVQAIVTRRDSIVVVTLVHL